MLILKQNKNSLYWWLKKKINRGFEVNALKFTSAKKW